jgi:hypothetical protein
MRIIKGLMGLALVGLSASALASEPVHLDAAALDQVSAGLYDTFAIAAIGPTLATGASTRTTNIAQFQTFELITLAPPNFAANAGAFAVVQSQVQSSNVGASSASNSGFVFSGIRPSIN